GVSLLIPGLDLRAGRKQMGLTAPLTLQPLLHELPDVRGLATQHPRLDPAEDIQHRWALAADDEPKPSAVLLLMGAAEVCDIWQCARSSELSSIDLEELGLRCGGRKLVLFQVEEVAHPFWEDGAEPIHVIIHDVDEHVSHPRSHQRR